VGSNPGGVIPKNITLVFADFFAKQQAALWSKSKDQLAQNKDNMSEWNDISHPLDKVVR
jgi:hypothetical protein